MADILGAFKSTPPHYNQIRLVRSSHRQPTERMSILVAVLHPTINCDVNDDPNRADRVKRKQQDRQSRLYCAIILDIVAVVHTHDKIQQIDYHDTRSVNVVQLQQSYFWGKSAEMGQPAQLHRMLLLGRCNVCYCCRSTCGYICPACSHFRS